MTKIGILASYNGSGFLALSEACDNKTVNAKISVVISNNSKANCLISAEEKNIKNYCVNQKLYPNENIDLKILQILTEEKCDYILLSGYMKKIDKCLIRAYENKIINCHPALLPKFGGKGMYGHFVHEAVIKAGEKESGCSVHYVNEVYDEGKIILQRNVILNKDETVESLENKIKNIENKTIVEAFGVLLN